MTIKNRHVNEQGDTEYTVIHRPQLKCCEPFRNENGDIEFTMHWQDVIVLPIPQKGENC